MLFRSTIVRMVEKSFELSEASNTPVMMELRIRACHLFGAFPAKTNVAAKHSTTHRFDAPAPFEYMRLAHPPVTFIQENDKAKKRLPAAQDFIVANALNEVLGPKQHDIGVIVQGGLFNALNSRLETAGLSNAFGDVEIPTLVLNVTHPLAPGQITQFCAGKKAVLIVEEGQPEFIEQAIGQILRKADLQTKIFGKDVLPYGGEYAPRALGEGLAKFLRANGRESASLEAWLATIDANGKALQAALPAPLPPRPPGLCTG